MALCRLERNLFALAPSSKGYLAIGKVDNVSYESGRLIASSGPRPSISRRLVNLQGSARPNKKFRKPVREPCLMHSPEDRNVILYPGLGLILSAHREEPPHHGPFFRQPWTFAVASALPNVTPTSPPVPSSLVHGYASTDALLQVLSDQLGWSKPDMRFSGPLLYTYGAAEKHCVKVLDIREENLVHEYPTGSRQYGASCKVSLILDMGLTQMFLGNNDNRADDYFVVGWPERSRGKIALRGVRLQVLSSTLANEIMGAEHEWRNFSKRTPLFTYLPSQGAQDGLIRICSSPGRYLAPPAFYRGVWYEGVILRSTFLKILRDRWSDRQCPFVKVPRHPSIIHSIPFDKRRKHVTWRLIQNENLWIIHPAVRAMETVYGYRELSLRLIPAGDEDANRHPPAVVGDITLKMTAEISLRDFNPRMLHMPVDHYRFTLGTSRDLWKNDHSPPPAASMGGSFAQSPQYVCDEADNQATAINFSAKPVITVVTPEDTLPGFCQTTLRIPLSEIHEEWDVSGPHHTLYYGFHGHQIVFVRAPEGEVVVWNFGQGGSQEP